MVDILKVAIPTVAVLFTFFTWYVGRVISDRNELTTTKTRLDGLEKRFDALEERFNELFKLK